MRIRIKYMAIGAAGGAFFGSFIGIIPAALETGITRGSYVEDFLNKCFRKDEFVNCTRNEDAGDPGVGYLYKSFNSTQNNYTESVGDDDLGNDYPIICKPRNSTKEQLLWNGANDYADSFPDSSIFYWLPSCIGICGGVSILVGAGGGYYLTDDGERVVDPVLGEDDVPVDRDQELDGVVVEGGAEDPNTPKKLTLQEQYDEAGCTDLIPEEYKCVITCKLMDDPMKTLPEGPIMDARTINGLKNPEISPFTRQPITSTSLDEELKEKIETWVKEKIALRQKAIINQKLQSDPILPPPPAAPPAEEKQRIVVPFLESCRRINPKYLCHATQKIMRDPVTAKR